ncbi:YitT family protein [Erysipelothrix sp. D19-032]
MEYFRKIEPKQYIGVILGAMLSATAITSFVRPADLVPRRSWWCYHPSIKEMNRLFGLTLSYGFLFLIINIILLSFVIKKLGKRFLILSFMHVFLTSIFVEILPAFKLTYDPILLAVFGGVVNGVGSSIALRMNGSLWWNRFYSYLLLDG